MKKVKILVTIALMSVTSIVISQDGETDNREKVQFGIKGGFNYSNVYNSRTDEFVADAKFGFAGGAFLRIPIGTYLGVQPELLISQKGFRGRGSMFGSDYNFSRTTTYVDVPIQLALNPTRYITILAGPQYSYLIRKQDDFSSSIYSDSHQQEFQNENIRKNIFGFVGGVDINVRHFVVGARMGWDITENNGDGTSDTPRYKNSWFQATIGYTFYN